MFVRVFCGLAGLILLMGATPPSGPAIESVQWRSNSQEKEIASFLTPEEKLAELTRDATSRHILVKLGEIPNDVKRTELKRLGLDLLKYVGDKTYFATIHSERVNIQELVFESALTDARSIRRYQRTAPSLLLQNIPDWTIAGTTADGGVIAATNILFQPDVELEAKAAEIALLYDAVIVDMLHTLNGCVMEIPTRHLEALGEDDEVLWIEPPLPQLGANNDGARALAECNLAQAPPYDLDGSGINVMMYDIGRVRGAHVDLAGRVTNKLSGTISDHSTHVAGTIGGTGTVSEGLYAGMAPNVRIFAYWYELPNPLPELLYYQNPANIEWAYDDAINNASVDDIADIANNSVGSNVALNGLDCEIEGNYGVTSALIDSIVRGGLGIPFRVVWSAGNERMGPENVPGACGTDYYTVPPPAGNKNAITVGAVYSDDDAMTTFSSWGPTDDGRIKPDVVAPGSENSPPEGETCPALGSPISIDPGCGICSCTGPNAQGYGVMRGTSMATPVVTGGLTLLLQDFQAHFPDRSLPRNSTLKAFLAQTAADGGNPGPDYQFGFGSVRIRRAIDFMRLDQFLERQVDQGESYVVYFVVESGDEEIELTLAWDDSPSAPNIVNNLVNDLDLRLFDPSGGRHYPWTLNPDDPAANAVRTQADHINNIEQVWIDNPMVGMWRAEVVGYSIPEGPQPFSLCSSHGMQPYYVTQAISRTWTICNSGAGDLDCDCIVDLSDLAQLLAHWGGTNNAFFEGDTDLDGDVDLSDLIDLLEVYSQTCE